MNPPKPKNKGHKLHLLNDYKLVLLVGVVGALVTLTAYLILERLHKNTFENEFIGESKKYIYAITEGIHISTEIIFSLKAFFDASEFVDRSEFRAFTKPIFKRHPEIQALEWVPKVMDSQREQYEKRAIQDGIRGFSFVESDGSGGLVPTPEQDVYYPVYYAEPFHTNKKVIGLAPSNNPDRRKTILQARDTGAMVIAPPLLLMQGKHGYLIFLPIYEGAANYASVELRRKHNKGFVLLVLLTEELIEASLKQQFLAFKERVYVEDISIPATPLPVFGTRSGDKILSYSETVDFAGRVWRITVYDKGGRSSNHVWPVITLIIGFIITALLMFMFFNFIRRHELVEKLVSIRTADFKMLNDMAANANDIFIIMENESLNDASHFRKIIYVNKAFERVSGVRAEQIIGRSFRSLFAEDNNADTLNKAQEVLEDGKAYHGELLTHKKDGTQYWVELNISPLKNEEGEIVKFGAVLRDVTQRKEEEVKREALIEKLADSNEELQYFAYVCSHDLKEPLRMLSMFSRKLEEHLEHALRSDEKGKKYLHFITDGADRAQELVSDILMYASLNNNTEKLEQFSTKELIDSIIRDMHMQANSDNIHITYENLPTLHANKTQIYQLLLNLINNGIKYQKNGMLPAIHVSAIDMGDFWQFAVRDNGIGMEKKYFKKIFEVFQRLQVKGDYPGTGVGLSICRKVVKRHGGTIWVESEIGKGSTFYFTLSKHLQAKNQSEGKHNVRI